VSPTTQETQHTFFPNRKITLASSTNAHIFILFITHKIQALVLNVESIKHDRSVHKNIEKNMRSTSMD
jgi:hypothetical protein